MRQSYLLSKGVMMAVSSEEICNIYRSILRREPLPAEIIFWLGVSSSDELKRICLDSDEYRSFPQEVEQSFGVTTLYPINTPFLSPIPTVPVMQENTSFVQNIKISPNMLSTNTKIQNINNNLIFDVGMSEGNDTAYYLEKGFHVVGVEADPVVYAGLLQRFSSEISDGRLIALHRAASGSNAKPMTFWRNEVAQGLSSLEKHDAPGYADVQKNFEVSSIDWENMISIAGTPHYCKIDIEGAERSFLGAMRETLLRPTYISSEIHSFDPIEILYDLGYRRFKIIDQNILHSFLPLPNPPLEGQFVRSPNWHHASGPFGKELPGDKWLNFYEIASIYDMLQRLRSYRTVNWTWFDIHAWMDSNDRN